MPPAGWRSPESPRLSPCPPPGPRGKSSAGRCGRNCGNCWANCRHAQSGQGRDALPGGPGRLRGGEVPVRQRRRGHRARVTCSGRRSLPGKAPAILYCHWHGGEYDIGKEELFQAKHTPEPPGPALAKRGFVVLGIDAYCFGERNGRGPGGPAEKGARRNDAPASSISGSGARSGA